MGKLNAEGIDRLEAIMLANGKYFYDQNAVFAKPTDCGTELCAAGFARLLEVGEETLALEAADFDPDEPNSNNPASFGNRCIVSGADLLGIELEKQGE